jgi:hypothetical protein
LIRAVTPLILVYHGCEIDRRRSMKRKVTVIAFAALAAVAGALTFEPSVTSARVDIKPSATPRRAKAAPRRTGAPVAHTGTTTAMPTSTSKPKAQNFGDTPGLNGGDMMQVKPTPKKPKHFIGGAEDGQSIRRKQPKHHH